MTINPDGMSLPPQVDLNARRTQLDARVQDATLSPSRTLDPETINQHNQFYNRAIDGSDVVRNWRNLPPDLEHLFPLDPIERATEPGIFDNDTAKQVKQEYRDLDHQVQRAETQARRLETRLGPGHHELSNGDHVDVSVDPQTGRHSVKVTRPDGTTREVEYGDDGHTSVRDQDRNGQEHSIDKNGNRITERSSDPFGRDTTTTYNLDGDGGITRDRRGPEDDQQETTHVHPDGSTDTRKLIYIDDNGRPVYENKHEDQGGFPGPIWNHPRWRPDPDSPFPWEWRRRFPPPEPLPLLQGQPQ